MARTDVRVSAIIIKNNEILLMHRKKNGEEYWVFPGGGVEDTETAEQAIIREVTEETNLTVLEHELAFMSYNETSKKDEPFYICEVSSGTPEIVGEEKDKNNDENWYQLEWVNLGKLQSILLVPEKAAREVIKRFR